MVQAVFYYSVGLEKSLENTWIYNPQLKQQTLVNRASLATEEGWCEAVWMQQLKGRLSSCVCGVKAGSTHQY